MPVGKKSSPTGISLQGSPVTLDADKFLKFCKRLQKELVPPKSLAEVFEGETLAVLKATSKKVKRTTLANAGGPYNLRSKKFKGWVRMNGKFHYVGKSTGKYFGFRYSDSMWNALMKRMKQLRDRAEARVGLSKAVFYRVAKDLRLSRYGSGWADSSVIKTAMTKSGGLGSPAASGPVWGTRKVATTSKNLRGNTPKIKFTINSTNTFNPFTKGMGKLQGSFNGREKYFEKGVEHGMMKDTKKIAAHYPNIYVTD